MRGIKGTLTHGYSGYYNGGCRCDVCREGQLRGAAERHGWMDGLKAAPCADCGGAFPPECMDWDHRPDEVKLFGPSGNYTRARERILAEIAKCDLVCANCHRIRTKQRRLTVPIVKADQDDRGAGA